MKMLRERWKNAKRVFMNKRMKYSFRVPNTAYICWEEIDDEMYKSDVQVFTVHSLKFNGKTVIAVARDFLTRYSAVRVGEDSDPLLLLDHPVCIQWGWNLAQVQEYFADDSEPTFPDLRGHYQYMLVAHDSIGAFKEELEKIRAIHLPKSKVFVSSI
jgi:hypothetical protein